MALTESQNTERLSRVPLAGLTAHLRAWLNDSRHRSIAQRVAGAAFVIRLFRAALIYLSQILFARWMGSFEFGIYVYVWTWVLLIGDLADLGLASAAQRFIPEYTCAAVYAVAFALNLVLCVLLIPSIGAAGAGVATTAALIVETLLLFWVTKRRLGFHVFVWGRP